MIWFLVIVTMEDLCCSNYLFKIPRKSKISFQTDHPILELDKFLLRHISKIEHITFFWHMTDHKGAHFLNISKTIPAIFEITLQLRLKRSNMWNKTRLSLNKSAKKKKQNLNGKALQTWYEWVRMSFTLMVLLIVEVQIVKPKA